MNEKANFVELTHISHSFGTQRVLSDVSFTCKKNNVTAILGTSGSGKSTLLQIMNGMIRPQGGEVMINGQPLDYDKIYSQRLQIGYVVQHVGLFPHMSIKDNIMLLGKISKKDTDELSERVKLLMEMVKLPLSYLDKYPHQLSGGEQQRAGLCRAMSLQPPLLLMDEPFASLDYATKQSIYDHLLDIQERESRTIVIVTHDWDEAIKLADQFVWLAEGTIKETGNKTKLIETKSNYLSAL